MLAGMIILSKPYPVTFEDCVELPKFRFTLTHLRRVDSFYLNSLDLSISNRRVCGLFKLSLPCSIEIILFNANSADPDQTSVVYYFRR